MLQTIRKRARSRVRWLVGLAFFAMMAGCATTPTRPVSEFEDIPVPKGLTLDRDQTTVIESPSVKAARLVYKGRIEVASLASAFRTTLEANGWRFISTATFANQGTTQVYEKAGDSLTVQISEGLWYTRVEITATKVLTRPTAGAAPSR